MKQPGRRSLLNATLTKKICAVLEKANTITTACAMAGISTTSYHTWVARGENGEAGYKEFADSCARARATAKQKLTDIIRRAAPRDPKLACWLLERLYPTEYGRVEHDGPASPQVPIFNLTFSKASDEEEAEIEKLVGKPPPDRQGGDAGLNSERRARR